MEIVDNEGVRYALPWRPHWKPVLVALTQEEFESVYHAWKCGACFHALAEEYDVPANTLAWCLVMRSGDKLREYDVHYRPTNK